MIKGTKTEDWYLHLHSNNSEQRRIIQRALAVFYSSNKTAQTVPESGKQLLTREEVP
jgi:hypothetical protein